MLLVLNEGRREEGVWMIRGRELEWHVSRLFWNNERHLEGKGAKHVVLKGICFIQYFPAHILFSDRYRDIKYIKKKIEILVAGKLQRVHVLLFLILFYYLFVFKREKYI